MMVDTLHRLHNTSLTPPAKSPYAGDIMTRVSRRPLKAEELKRTRDAFLKAVVVLRTKSDVEEFLQGFLTPSEWKMFTKRLAVADMLSYGASYAKIEERLKVSNTTIARIRNLVQLQGAGVQKLLRQLQKES